MSSNLTLDDIQNAFDIIDENGGLGSWEEGTQTSSAERWEFPRFPGADKLGKCSTKAHGVKGNHEEIKSCKGWAPDGATLYLSRSGLGPYDSDVETICAWLDAPGTWSAASSFLANRAPERLPWRRQRRHTVAGSTG